MNTEQKAKAYDEALKRAREWHNDPHITIGLKGNLEDIFPELKESEDEKVRKHLISLVKNWDKDGIASKYTSDANDIKQILAWLKKQKEPELSEDLGKYVTELNKQFPEISFAKLSRIAVRVKNWLEKQGEQTLSQTNERAWLYLVSDVLTWKDGIGQYLDEPRVQELAKKLCGEYAQKLYNSPVLSNSSNTGNNKQKPDDKVEPKFHEGDWIVQGNIGVYKVIEICESWYEVIDFEDNHYSISFDKEYMCHLWTIQDAKDGDVLYFNNDISGFHSIGLFKRLASKNEINGGTYRCYARYGGFNEESKLEIAQNNNELHHCGTKVYPATKEQRDLLFSKMGEAGYEWDAEKKELKTVDKKSQRVVSAEAKEALYNKPAWSEEDEEVLRTIISDGLRGAEFDMLQINWLKSLKQRIGG